MQILMSEFFYTIQPELRLLSHDWHFRYLPSHLSDTYRIVRRARGHFHHHIGIEYVSWEKDPENVVDEQACQEESWHLEARQPNERYHGDA